MVHNEETYLIYKRLAPVRLLLFLEAIFGLWLAYPALQFLSQLIYYSTPDSSDYISVAIMLMLGLAFLRGGIRERVVNRIRVSEAERMLYIKSTTLFKEKNEVYPLDRVEFQLKRYVQVMDNIAYPFSFVDWAIPKLRLVISRNGETLATVKTTFWYMNNPGIKKCYKALKAMVQLN